MAIFNYDFVGCTRRTMRCSRYKVAFCALAVSTYQNNSESQAILFTLPSFVGRAYYLFFVRLFVCR